MLDSNFSKLIVEDLTAIIPNSAEELRNSVSYDDPPKHISYQHGSAKWLLEVDKTYLQLTTLPKYFDLCSNKLLEENNIEIPLHMRIFMEHYLIKVSSHIDKCAQLANHVFQVGIKPRNVTRKSLLSKIKYYETKKNFKHLVKFTNQIQQKRNAIVHKSSDIDSNLNEIDTLSIIAAHNKKYKALYDELCKNYNNGIRELCEELNKTIEEHTINFLNSLTEQYSIVNERLK
ncbi:Cthe_2314 family HEPN domain-containing protein [uncultured Pseudodesulfovibrio sp.]|uniref:Cthe_2314 family HEPN domain-containing protein n=1 Tax=uncultured Pseudodesulfovibrio sp. TaxID=2035858 RepID=UPI0029C8AF6C|nr:Cthe_2314 family HEPN domain-containing protein [uncultured Pseudodesulfovibrio sp.]